MEVFIGTILPWPMNWAPQGWALCNGALLPVSQNPALFSLLGVNYGGDGYSTFGLPNLCGRVPMGMGITPGTGISYALGTAGGTAQTTLAVQNLPAHAHTSTAQTDNMSCSCNINYTIPAANTAANTDTPSATNCCLAKASYTGRPAQIYNNTVTAPDVQMPGGTVAGSGTVSGNISVQIGNTGSNAPFNNMPPYQVINYIIATTGIYPCRP